MKAEFDRLFKPTKEQLLKRYEYFLQSFKEQRGGCGSCLKCLLEVDSGLTTGYGGCADDCPWYFKKFCGDDTIVCMHYKEDVEWLNEITKKIEELKEEVKHVDGNEM